MTIDTYEVPARRPAARPVTTGQVVRSRRRRSEGAVAGALSQVVLVIWALLIIVPLLWVVLAAFKTNTEIFGNAWSMPHHLSFAAFGRAWTKAHIGRYMLNSVVIVAFSTFFTMLLGSMAAYVLARYKFFGNRFLYYFFVAGLAFPVFLAIVPLFFVVKDAGTVPGIGPYIGLNSRAGLILVYIAYSLPFTVFFMTAFFRTLPSSVAEAATMDGASHTRLFFQVMLPMARPGIISIGIFNILGQWNQYLLPVVLLQGENADKKWVLTQGIAGISVAAGYEADWPALFAALTFAIIPMVIIYIVFQRQIQNGLTAGSVK
ncbi:MAG TPA: carbohydrate ABC transporter permease [Rugosimonospora sp.]|nr:carbohydrate ABC transporter permease [Rugosimonospora sp.]